MLLESLLFILLCERNSINNAPLDSSSCLRQESKLEAIMADAIEYVIIAESKGKAVAEAAEVCAADNLEKVGVEALIKADAEC